MKNWKFLTRHFSHSEEQKHNHRQPYCSKTSTKGKMNFKRKRIDHQHHEIHIKLNIHLEEGNTNHNIGTHREIDIFESTSIPAPPLFPRAGAPPPPAWAPIGSPASVPSPDDYLLDCPPHRKSLPAPVPDNGGGVAGFRFLLFSVFALGGGGGFEII